MGNIHDFKHELGRLLSGVYQPLSADNEKTWKDIWLANEVASHDPLAMALVGGALADRLAWVFHAGYQGMMRCAFPFCPKQGWASYLVAEDKTGEYEGASLSGSGENITLTGFKSWVAASRNVDYLVVQVQESDDNILLLLEGTEPGISLTHRDRPGFLADLSQGFAAFEAVRITPDKIFSSQDLAVNFSLSEPHHVLTALNAFMVSQSLSHGGHPAIEAAASRSLELTAKLVESDASDDVFLLGIADLDAGTTDTARQFEDFIETHDEALHTAWQKDRGLVNMFSRGLQKKAQWLRER